jgi:capsular exopolysaccharide synthesis family protein
MMELSDYVRVLRAHWIGVLALSLIGIALAAAYTVTQPKVYAANANGFVTTGASSDPALASVNDSLAKSRATSYVDIATSRAVANQVIEDLGLDASASSLIGAISVVQPPDTVLLKITARSSSPQEAQQLANAWVSALSAQVDDVENPQHRAVSSAPHVVPVEAAALPSAPVLPRTRVNLMLGLALGGLLGLAYAVLRSQLDRRLRSSAVVEKQFGIVVVGSVPSARALAHAPRTPLPLVVGEHAREGAEGAEAFRKLRTNLAYMNVDNPPRTIVVTSPQQEDGKSTVAANLAAAIALSGQPVTLVDGDLRRPTVAENLGLVEGAGLTDVLIGRAEVEDVLQQHADFPELAVLAAGSVPPNPSELLGSQAMRAVLDGLAAKGMVIIDAPPLLPVTDAAVLTTHCDGSLVVVSYGKTTDTELGDSLTNLANVHATVLGVIFNRVPRHNAAGGYYGRYQEASAATPPQPEARVTPAGRV